MHFSGLTNVPYFTLEINEAICSVKVSLGVLHRRKKMQRHDLVGNFQHKVGTTSSRRNCSPFLLGDPRYGQFVFHSEEPRAIYP